MKVKAKIPGTHYDLTMTAVEFEKHHKLVNRLINEGHHWQSILSGPAPSEGRSKMYRLIFFLDKKAAKQYDAIMLQNDKGSD